MKHHPAQAMIVVWLIAFALLFILPFNIVNRSLSLYGYFMIIVSLAAFCVGAWVRTPTIALAPQSGRIAPNFQYADPLFALVALLAIVVLLYELRQGTGGDLSASWQVRDDRAAALLAGSDSGSSLSFKLGFLLSPVSYAVIAREIVFRNPFRPIRFVVLGFGPLIASSLALGGRGPLLFGMTFSAFAYLARRQYFRVEKRDRKPKNPLLIAAITIFALMALNYFVKVFVVRAEGAGGVEGVMDITAEIWGVSFDGPMADAMKATLGVGTTYLVFVFVWYLVQGIVIANELFTAYAGPPHFGVYGIELVTALMRRFNGSFISDRFAAIQDLNIYGFLPSAVGSLYVDFRYFALLLLVLWGYLAGLVYEKTRLSPDARWYIAAPFVLQGIVFSLLNTPIGLTNGLVTHAYMLLMFVMTRPPIMKRSTAEDAYRFILARANRSAPVQQRD